jgi:MerR family mercuric resistance operon transcriptional regulator
LCSTSAQNKSCSNYRFKDFPLPPSNTDPRAGSLSIGNLSRHTGVNIETIRYYERIGLVPAPPRTQGRHRLYDEAHRQRLAFIRRSRDLGFSINETRDLLGLARGHNLTCAEVKALTEQHLAGIRAKIRDLRKLDRVLSNLAAKCRDHLSSSVPDCPILDALAGATTSL